MRSFFLALCLLFALPAPAVEIEEATIAELADAFDSGELTAVALTEHYLARIEAIDRSGQ